MLDFFCSCPIGRWSYFFNTPRTLWEKGIWIDFRSGYCVVFLWDQHVHSFFLLAFGYFLLFAGFPLLLCDLLQLYPSYPLPLPNLTWIALHSQCAI
ncbi:hypothetical protein BDV40DRAFT_282089 [Aspergillus tamarii]|uniref:Uncharacterized protein n=1 Tax=Aspergillus tamarii TaxID=41984 RepID=A0A5N6UC25_ASPTM|nr:hypothetical protein BDV40DRAFT_282089 [Aspergillus tamarii]